MPSPSALQAALSAERTALSAFVALLEREQALLVENKTDDLFDLSEIKTREALNLDQLSERRLHLLQQNIPQPTLENIPVWLRSNLPSGLPVWQEIVTLAQQAMKLNQLNGDLIQFKLRHNLQALTVLNNAINKASIYGRNGQTDFSSAASGRTLGSG